MASLAFNRRQDGLFDDPANTLCPCAGERHRRNPRNRHGLLRDSCVRCLERFNGVGVRASTGVDSHSTGEPAADLTSRRSFGMGSSLHNWKCAARFRDLALLLVEKLYNGRLRRCASIRLVAIARTNRGGRGNTDAWLVDQHHRCGRATDLQYAFAVIEVDTARNSRLRL